MKPERAQARPRTWMARCRWNQRAEPLSSQRPWREMTMPAGISTPHATAISQPCACQPRWEGDAGTRLVGQPMTGLEGPYWPQHHHIHAAGAADFQGALQILQGRQVLRHPGQPGKNIPPLSHWQPHIAHRLHTRGQALHAAAGASGQVHGRSTAAAAVVLQLTSCRQKERIFHT